MSLRRYALVSGVAFAAIGLSAFVPALSLGAVPATKRLFGYWPLWGNEAILHGTSAAVGAYFGFGPPAREVVPEGVRFDLPYASDDRAETFFA